MGPTNAVMSGESAFVGRARRDRVVAACSRHSLAFGVLGLISVWAVVYELAFTVFPGLLGAVPFQWDRARRGLPDRRRAADLAGLGGRARVGADRDRRGCAGRRATSTGRSRSATSRTRRCRPWPMPATCRSVRSRSPASCRWCGSGCPACQRRSRRTRPPPRSRSARSARRSWSSRSSPTPTAESSRSPPTSRTRSSTCCCSGLIVGATALGNWRLNRTWVLLAASVLAFWIADSVYVVADATGTYTQNDWYNALWYWAPVLAAWAAWVPRRVVAWPCPDGSAPAGSSCRWRSRRSRSPILVWSSFDRVGVIAVAARDGLAVGGHGPSRADVAGQRAPAPREPG